MLVPLVLADSVAIKGRPSQGSRVYSQMAGPQDSSINLFSGILLNKPRQSSRTFLGILAIYAKWHEIHVGTVTVGASTITNIMVPYP